MLIRFFIISLLAWASLPTTAQTMVKCKQSNGTYSFQDTPCSTNSKQELNPSDVRGDAQTAPREGAGANSQLAPPASLPPVTKIVPVSSPEPVLASDPGQADKSVDTPTASEPKSGSKVLLAIFVILVTAGHIWMLIVAFKNSIIWFLLCLFFFPSIYIFSLLNWPEAKKPFLTLHFGVAMLIFAIVNG